MVNEQKIRRKWADYIMDLRVILELESQKIDAESSVMRLAHKHRRSSFESYIKG